MGTAVISDCQNYRYRLTRELGLFGDKVFAYFGVNPSTADATIDDRTVSKWIGFTERNGGSRFIVGNVFAYRATDVKELSTAKDPIGPDNDNHILQIISEADILVPCWGSRNKIPPALQFRLDEVLSMLSQSGKPVLTFGLTQSNDPKHPLMLPYTTDLVELTYPNG